MVFFVSWDAFRKMKEFGKTMSVQRQSGVDFDPSRPYCLQLGVTILQLFFNFGSVIRRV